MGTLLLPRRISGQIECFLPTSHPTILATHAQPPPHRFQRSTVVLSCSSLLDDLRGGQEMADAAGSASPAPALATQPRSGELPVHPRPRLLRANRPCDGHQYTCWETTVLLAYMRSNLLRLQRPPRVSPIPPRIRQRPPSRPRSPLNNSRPSRRRARTTMLMKLHAARRRVRLSSRKSMALPTQYQPLKRQPP